MQTHFTKETDLAAPLSGKVARYINTSSLEQLSTHLVQFST